MKIKNSKLIFSIILIILVLSTLFLASKFLNKNNNENIHSNESNTSVANIDKDSINKLNEIADFYYIQNFNKEFFVSQFGYLIKKDKTEATVQDIAEFSNYDLPEELKNTVIHFVQPKRFLKYPSIKIKEQEGELDLDVLTVYTAVPLEDGSVYISSKYDEGGILNAKEYKEFILESSPINGEIVNPKPNSSLYKEIRKAVEEEDRDVLGGNIKYLCADNKYAFVVISSGEDTANIKSFLLENNNKKWEVARKNLEKNVKYKYTINVNYPNFNLDMLPIYNLAEFNPSSDASSVVERLKKQGNIKEDDSVIYSCVAGKFAYIELKLGDKILVFSNSNNELEAFIFNNYLDALKKMVELDSENPPTFIINFEN